ncbi:hypothetical protein [Echinicola vietnamensis]|uniref:Histidine kinase N-terminal 7TM region domain-containing protein n=1 Tax=Echinicola vietnamensis (strain DSM 17526 / LMG 23754 / KMM 6221) TaxID=926556 RepID=L0FU08_ECHVK|nr:hypothetical protein [Echinicola vietnamensis]AGA77389.1 hypothetical protein Echvi_1118 [Echinicola vietnamensis DSM 17526]
MSQIAYLGVILCSLVGGVICYFYNKPTYKSTHKLLLITLLFVFLLEAVGEYTASKQINNLLLYNVCWIYIESYLIVYYFSLLEHKKKLRRLYFVLFGVAMVWGLYNSLFIQPIQTHFQYYSLLPMGLLILGLSVRFFYSVIRLEKYSQADLLSIPHLWIVAFITFFYVEALTLFGFMEFYASANLDIIIAWTKLNRIIAGVMYLSFGLAFYTPNIFEKKLA